MAQAERMITSLLDQLDPDIGLVVREYINQPLHDAAELSRQVDEYLIQIRALDDDSCVDVALAERLGESCRTLLAQDHPQGTPEWSAVQAAVRYFLEEDDVDADLESATGFEDDAEVVDLVTRLVSAVV